MKSKFLLPLFLLLFGVCRQGYSQSLFDKVLEEDQRLAGPRSKYFTYSSLSFNRHQLRDLAFCQCIYHLLRDSTKSTANTFFDRDLSSGFLLEISNYDMLAYNAVDSFAAEFVCGTNWHTIEDSVKGGVIDCIWFYNSKHLEKFIEKQDKYFLGSDKRKRTKN